jgi:hypothetical protein
MRHTSGQYSSEPRTDFIGDIRPGYEAYDDKRQNINPYTRTGIQFPVKLNSAVMPYGKYMQAVNPVGICSLTSGNESEVEMSRCMLIFSTIIEAECRTNRITWNSKLKNTDNANHR